jgi:hypothetical protein
MLLGAVTRCSRHDSDPYLGLSRGETGRRLELSQCVRHVKDAIGLASDSKVFFLYVPRVLLWAEALL